MIETPTQPIFVPQRPLLIGTVGWSGTTTLMDAVPTDTIVRVDFLSITLNFVASDLSATCAVGVVNDDSVQAWGLAASQGIGYDSVEVPAFVTEYTQSPFYLTEGFELIAEMYSNGPTSLSIGSVFCSYSIAQIVYSGWP